MYEIWLVDDTVFGDMHTYHSFGHIGIVPDILSVGYNVTDQNPDWSGPSFSLE